MTPTQSLPLTSSTERTHLLSEHCWCQPFVFVMNGKVTQVQHNKEKA